MPKRILSGVTITVLTLSQVLFSFPFSVPQVKEAQAATRLGLHATQEELNCWRQRAGIDPQGSNGITCPVIYKSVGDVRPNSPGDWNTILNNASQNLANQRFAGWTSAGCVPNGFQMGAILPKGDYIRDAAFAYMVTGTLSRARHKYLLKIRPREQVPRP
jgi:hypothetical protein